MKKLMIAAAAAALATGAYAAKAQVYDASFTVKTTVVKEGKVTKTLVKNVLGYDSDDVGTEIEYRTQGTRKFAGLFWGCDCETIALPDWRVYFRKYNPVGGYVFWETKGKESFIVPHTRFSWYVLNRISKSGNKVEGAWQFANNHREQAFFFTGAGFGTATAGKSCETYLKSISGSFAGWMLGGGEGGCLFCGTLSDAVWAFCPCYDITSDLTAAYGTWKIKYNSSASKKLTSHNFITKAYSFKNLDDVESNILWARAALLNLVVGEVPAVRATDVEEEDEDEVEATFTGVWSVEVDEDGEPIGELVAVADFGDAWYQAKAEAEKKEEADEYADQVIGADEEDELDLPEFAVQLVNTFVQGS